MNRAGHLTQEEMDLLHEGGLGKEEAIRALDHIAACADCALAYAESLAPQMLRAAPGGFSEVVNSKIARKKREFALYSFRVGLATCATLLLVLWGAMHLKQVEPPPSPRLDFVNQWNEKLYQVSNRILEGGLLHETEK